MRDDLRDRFEVTKTQISDLLSVTVFFLRLDLYFVHRFPQIAVGIFSIRWFRCVSAPRLRCIVELLQSCDSISHGIGLSFAKLVAVQNAKKAEGNGHTMVREVSPDKTQRPKDPKAIELHLVTKASFC